MIALISGTLRELHGDTALIETAGGIGYSVTVPLGVLERLPAPGATLRLYTELVVREDSWALYGFDRAAERTVFQRLLSASGVGPKLALAVISTLGPERAARSIKERDIAALATVPGIGRKKAEKLVVELGDRFDTIPAELPATALLRLGYAAPQAEDAVRRAVQEGNTETAKVIRHALQTLSARRA